MDRIDHTFINAIFTPDYYKSYLAIENYVAKIVLRIINNAGIGNYLLEESRSIDEIIERYRVHPQSGPILDWSLRYLHQNGYLKKSEARYQMYASTRLIDASEDIDRILTLMPSADIFIKLVSHIESNMPMFLSGQKSGADILFVDKAAAVLWNDYFNNSFYGYSVLNYGVAYGITKWFSQTGGISMLELGSGTSGATVKVFRMLRDNCLLDTMNNIVLTDVVPSLLVVGDQNIHKNNIIPKAGYKQKILDINRPFTDQEIGKDSFDIIYGVNVLHVARNLSNSLAEIYSCLNKNGFLAIAETIRPFDDRAMHHEIIFNLLENYHSVQLDPETRPAHGFLTKENWLANLTRAGFNNIDCLSEPERIDQLDIDIKPLHSALVLVARK
ncbi:MAG TPA: class I SAM-dependent methyltransferase [Dissulfurispiraceae bacterium]|nr:class I SAM-dependent methyltransferase [Dissulfurispiraceae bacterium]